MTPGLAGFLASGDNPPEWDEVVASVFAALQAGFAVVPERGGTPSGVRRATWFDTFDWRLYRAGLILEYVVARRGGELRLVGAEQIDADTTQPVTGWQASRPHLPPELPDGPVAARIAGVVAPRALLPAVTVSSTATVSRLLNEDGKTVARLLVERPSVGSGTAPGKQTALPPRLTITEVRGYPGQARRAARIVALAPGVLPATESVFADALRAVGRSPGDYSNKVDAPITAAMPADEAAAIILLRLLDTIEANVTGVLHDTDTEFLHDLRVSVRRTRSALKLFGDTLASADNSKRKSAAAAATTAATTATTTTTAATTTATMTATATTTASASSDNSKSKATSAATDNSKSKATAAATAKRAATLTLDDVARFAAEFKWVGDLTTPTRDLDVHLLDFEETAQSLAAAKPDDLEPFRAYLQARRVKEFRALTRGLHSERFTSLISEWRATLTKITGSKRAGKARATGRSGLQAGETASTLAIDRTRRAFEKVAKRGAAITPVSPHESLHDLRKRCKELRYALEFFAPLHDPADYGKVLGDLKRLQDCLGEFQDTEVQIFEIRSLATSMLAANEAPAVTLLAMGEVTAGLATRQQAARADFERRFAAFGGADGQRRMAALLRGGAA